jgi:hypothetical protein
MPVPNLVPTQDARVIGKISARDMLLAAVVLLTLGCLVGAVGWWNTLAAPVEPEQTSETFLRWKGWPELLGLLIVAAVDILCFVFWLRLPQLRASSDALLRACSAQGIVLLPVPAVTDDPYGGAFPGAKAENFIRSGAESERLLESLAESAPDGGREAIDRLEMVSVLCFKSRKKAAAARARLSLQGDRLEGDGRIVRLGYSLDRMVIRHKNMLIYYNGRCEAIRAALDGLREE